MASEPIECQVLALRVSIHCEGCKKKVKKVLQNINGVYRCEIDARSNKVEVTASTKLDPYILIAKLRKSGKQAEPWPEQPVQQQQPPAESQIQEAKNQNDGPSQPNEPAEKPGADDAEDAAAGPSNPQPSPEPEQSSGEAPKPAQESAGASNAEAGGNTGAPTTAAAAGAGQQPPTATKGKATPPPEEQQPVEARVTVEFADRGAGGGYVNRMPQQHPVHVMSYNVARPSASASYYATAPAPRPGPPQAQGYIDEQYTPPYYGRSSPYEPYYYPPQPSPYRHHYQQASSDDYYYGAPPPPPQRSAFSPPRDGYGDMFNDENANSCSVM